NKVHTKLPKQLPPSHNKQQPLQSFLNHQLSKTQPKQILNNTHLHFNKPTHQQINQPLLQPPLTQIPNKHNTTQTLPTPPKHKQANLT
ncbi:hypothetical protein, partial [Staphylococcus warneri]|uniref:hypothetical protein n=1 Tax=Staphylococcus warneri TaxID=1292 RepID=UPI001643825A